MNKSNLKGDDEQTLNILCVICNSKVNLTFVYTIVQWQYKFVDINEMLNKYNEIKSCSYR